MKNKFIGRHLILDIHTITNIKLCDKELIYDFLEKLSKELDMTLVYPPLVARFPFAGELDRFVKDLKKEKIQSKTLRQMQYLLKRRETKEAGISGIIIWLESHASIHTWPEYNYCSLDIYSCKEFDITKAIDLIHLYFDINYYQGLNITRKLNGMDYIPISWERL